MNEILMMVVGCACLAGAAGCVHYRRRKAWERRCSHCQSMKVDRVIIMCPRTRKDHVGAVENTLVGDDMLFVVFKFTYCRRCKKQVRHEKEYKIFSLGSLRHKGVWQSGAFRYDPRHFIEAGINPKDINMSFDPVTLGTPSKWEWAGVVF
ncbi:hypothetical protein EPO17_00235 [Patescibacteria group bacterium]|nr:MAG: hypothetical protein EPO17_00235 [Patescibacteria group bacterium]